MSFAVRRAARVHGYITASDYQNFVSKCIRIRGFEVIQCVDYIRNVFARNVKSSRNCSASGNEDRIVGRGQFLQADVALAVSADIDIALERDAGFFDKSVVLVNIAAVKPEFGNAISQHAAQFLVFVENGYVNAFFSQHQCGCYTGRAAADDGDFLSFFRTDCRMRLENVVT